MRGYAGLDAPSSACVRFVREREVDEEDLQEIRALRKNGILVRIIDGSRLVSDRIDLFQLIGESIPNSNLPYGQHARVELLDDILSTFASHAGIIIIIANANIVIDECREDFFDLIELFLIQFHNWSSGMKPCYLCFQMEPSNAFAEFVEKFGDDSSGL